MTDKITAHQRAVQQIDAAIAAYRAIGMHVPTYTYTGTRADYEANLRRYPIPMPTMRKILRAYARDHRFLWVTAKTHNWYSEPRLHHHMIRFPNTKRAAQLAAPLLPGAADWHSPFGGSSAARPLTVYRGETFWQFKFTGAEGHKILHRWCERLQTDPLFTKALGFTPTGNGAVQFPSTMQTDASRLAA